jgi:hypothetical protein
MFEHMTIAERIQAAKEKTERVVLHLLYLLALHENNAIIVYSSTLSSRIPYSHAANAFNVLQAAYINLRSCGCARFGTERGKPRRISQRLRS